MKKVLIFLILLNFTFTNIYADNKYFLEGVKLFEKKEFDFVIPMDGDGEDRPEEIKNFIQLSEKSSERSIIGERVKRSEGLFFQLCYKFHKFLTLAFTGKSVKFGNFTLDTFLEFLAK